MQRFNKLILCAVLLIATHSLQAADFSPDYVVASYLSVKSDERNDEFNRDLAASSLDAVVTQKDLNRSGWSPYIGFRLRDSYAFELGYVDLGDVSTRITGNTVDIDTFLTTAKQVYPVTASGWTASLAKQESFLERVSGGVKVGAFFWQADYKLTSTNRSQRYTEEGLGVVAGLWVNGDVTSNIFARTGINLYRFDGINITAWELGVGYRF